MTGIYSFNHDSFGKTTNTAGSAGNNVKYNADLSKTQMKEFLEANAKYVEDHGTQRPQWQIDAHLAQLRGGRSAAENAAYNAREEAAFAIRSHIIPSDPNEAKAWFDAQEKADRKNARMSDRFIGALPRELTPEQCIEAVESFCKGVTKDRVPWHFALHLELDKRDQPDWNPHTHIIFRDRDIETGKRYLYTTAGPKERKQLDEKGIEYWSTQKLRVAWQDHINHALERAEQKVRIDHRTLAAQGIFDRKPQIHVGPKASALKRKGIQPKSKDFTDAKRHILYTVMDNGTRADHNERIKQDSQRPKKAIHPKLAELAEVQTEARKAIYREQKRDRDALRAAHNKQISEHKKWAKELYAATRKQAYAETKAVMQDRWKAARKIKKRAERNTAMATLKLHQKVLYANTAAKLVLGARKEKDAAYTKMHDAQIKDRAELREKHRQEYLTMNRQHLAERLGVQEQLYRDHIIRKMTKGGMNIRMDKAGMAHQQRAALQLLRLYNRKLTPG